MPNGHLGSRGSIPGGLLLGWIPTIEDVILGIGTPTIYYRADDPISAIVAADYTAARPGTYNGAVTQGFAGPSYSAASFSAGAYLNSTTTPLNLATGTISFWCKFTSYPSSNTLLFGLINSSTVFDKTFSLSNAGTLTFTAKDTANRTITYPSLPLSRWNHIAVTMSGTTATLYVNGNSVGTVALGSSFAGYSSNTNLYVGSGSSSPASSTFPGNLAMIVDEIVAWDGIIANGDQIQQIYHFGALSITTSTAQVTQQSVEIIRQENPHARVTTQTIEVLRKDSSTVRVTNMAIEVVRQTAVQSAGTVNDVLTYTQTVSYVYSPNPPKALSDTLTFTHTAVGFTQGHWHAATATNTLTFSQSTVGLNAGHGITQTLVYTDSFTKHFSIRNEHILHRLDFTQTIDKPGSTYSQNPGQVLTFTQSTPANNRKDILQGLNFVETILAPLGKRASNTLNFTQTVIVNIGSGHAPTDHLTFTQRVNLVRPVIRVIQTLVYNQTPNMGLIVASACDRGTLGDTPTGDFVLGVDCGAGGPSGFAEQSLVFTQSNALRKIYHRSIVDNLVFTQPISLPTGFVRNRGITQTLTFFDKDFPRQIAIGTGTGYVYQQPVLIQTVVRTTPSRDHTRLVITIASPKGVITLPAPVFDDSEKTNNKIQIQKVMSTKTYTYVKRVDRLTLKYEFELDRRKSLELQAYYAFNQSDFLVLTNWKGQIYVGKFGNNPIELSTTGRNNQCDFEFVTVSIEFQGVRIHG